MVLCPASVLFFTLTVSSAAVTAIVEEKNDKVWPSNLIDCEQLMVRSIKLLRSPFLQSSFVSFLKVLISKFIRVRFLFGFFPY